MNLYLYHNSDQKTSADYTLKLQNQYKTTFFSPTVTRAPKTRTFAYIHPHTQTYTQTRARTHAQAYGYAEMHMDMHKWVRTRNDNIWITAEDQGRVQRAIHCNKFYMRVWPIEFTKVLRTDGGTHGWMDRQYKEGHILSDRRTVRWTDRWMDRQTDRQTDGRRDGWTDRWTDKRIQPLIEMRGRIKKVVGTSIINWTMCTS